MLPFHPVVLGLVKKIYLRNETGLNPGARAMEGAAVGVAPASVMLVIDVNEK